MTIDHQIHFPAPTPAECLEEFHKPAGIEHPGIDLAPEPTFGAHRADGIDLLALPGGFDHGGMPLQPIGAAQIGFGTKARFVQKEDRGPMLAGPAAQPWVALLEPFFHGLRIAFIGPAQRLLRGDVQAGQQPPHRRELEADAKLLGNELRHDLPRPQPKVETILARILADDPTAHLLALPTVELGLWPASLAQEQGRLPSLLMAAQPRIDRGPTQAQRTHHLTGALAILDHAPHRDQTKGLQ